MSRPLLALTLPLALAACVADNADSALVILRNVDPTTGCVADPSSEVARTAGTIQTNATFGYVLTPVVRNDLVTVEGESPTRKSVFLEGARVTIAFYDAELFTAAELDTLETDGLTRFMAPTSGALEPNGSTQTFQLEVVPRELLAAIDAKLPTDVVAPSTLIDVQIEMYGQLAGSEIRSNKFHYPVTVCRDCLISSVGLCSAIDPGTEYRTGGACNTLQDGIVDCCTDADGLLVCPATAPPQN